MKRINLKRLRNHLRLSQAAFIEQFLTEMSIPTYSIIETKGGARLNEVILSVSEQLQLDPMIFSMDPDIFSEQIEHLLPEKDEIEEITKKEVKKSNGNQILKQLIMYLSEELYAGRLKKGDCIQSNRELAAKLNVSRGAIREALKVMDLLGLVDIRPGQGTYISSKEADFFLVPLSWALYLNIAKLDEIMEVRRTLEVRAAELAAQNMTKAGERELLDIMHKIQKAYANESYREFHEADFEFHICIAKYSGNQALFDMICANVNLVKKISESGMVEKMQMEDNYFELQKILNYILARESEMAGVVMKEHLSQSVERYKFI